MNAGELADTVQWGRHLCRMTPEEADTITKSLRFAADMERLMAETWELSMTGPWPNGSYVIQTRSLFTVEKDIYTAARKAVEKLEKGEQK